MRSVILRAFGVVLVSALVVCSVGSRGSAAPVESSARARPASAPATQPADAAVLRTRLPDVKLDHIPLPDVIDGLSDLTGVSMTINEAALAAAGVKHPATVTFNLQNLTLGEALDGMLKPFAAADVTYRTDGAAIWISTRADLDHLDAFRARHAAPFAALGVADQPLAADADAANGRPNLRMPGAGFKRIFAELSRRGGVQIRADFDVLGVTSRKMVPLQLRDPTLRDALTEALWKTGRIDALDLQVEGKTITVVPRVKPAAT